MIGETCGDLAATNRHYSPHLFVRSKIMKLLVEDFLLADIELSGINLLLLEIMNGFMLCRTQPRTVF